MKADAKIWVAVAAIGALLGGLGAMTGPIGIPSRGSEASSVSVAVFDTAGIPATGTFLVFPDGQRFEPNLDGVYAIPTRRAGQEASLREEGTRREVCRILLHRGRGEFRRITIPRVWGGSC